jgi:transcription termination factor NusB
MSVYLCEDFARDHNQKWEHKDDCLLCSVLKYLDEMIESASSDKNCWMSFEDCDQIEAIKEQILDSEDLDKCTTCKHEYEGDEDDPVAIREALEIAKKFAKLRE